MTTPSNDPGLPPLIKQIPPTSVASPSELRPRDVGDVQWYKPSVSVTLNLLGWRWIFFLPAAGLILLLFAWPWYLWLSQLIFVWWKLVVIAVVVPTGYAINITKNILRNRKEPFCIHCGYDLSGLPDNHTCPECGELYNFRLIEEYKRDPHWFIERYSKHKDIPLADVPFESRKSTRPRAKDGTS